MMRNLLRMTAAAAVFAAAPAPSATLFGLVDTGELFASTDQGTTWDARCTLPVPDAVALGAERSSSDLRLSTRAGVFWVSADAGFSWVATGTVPGSDVTGLAVRPNGTVLLLGETGSLWESVDGGVTFAAIAALAASDCVDLAVASSTHHFALTRNGEVFRSTDAGTSWVAVGAMSVPDAVGLRYAEGSLYTLTGTGDLHSSTDDGATWAAVGTLSQVGMAALLECDGELVAISREGHTAVSSDGIAWTWRGSINQLELVGAGTDTPATGVDMLPQGAVTLLLSPPWPNPRRASGASTFTVTTVRAEIVSLALMDVAGRVIARRAAEALPSAGTHTLRWDPGNPGAGVYFVRLETASGRTAGTRWAMLR